MTISVQVYKKGVLVTKLIPANQIEVEIDKKKVKVEQLIDGFINKNKTLEKEITDIKKHIELLQKNDVEWKKQTNEVLTQINQKLNEMGEIY